MSEETKKPPQAEDPQMFPLLKISLFYTKAIRCIPVALRV